MLTRTPASATSAASDFANGMSAPLVAAYAEAWARPTWARPDANTTTAPRPAATMCGTTAWVAQRTPSRFTASVWRHALTGQVQCLDPGRAGGADHVGGEVLDAGGERGKVVEQ